MKKAIFKSSVLLNILTILFFSTLFLLPIDVSAQTYTPQVDIPGGVSGETVVDGSLLGTYIKGIYDYSIAIGGILAAIVLMGGGVMWLVSGGNQSKVSEAKSIITGSIIGLALLFSSYLILNTINPDLVKFKSLDVTTIGPKIEVSTCCTCTFKYRSKFKDKYGYVCHSEEGFTEEQCEEFCKVEDRIFRRNNKIMYTNVSHHISTDSVCMYRRYCTEVNTSSEVADNGFQYANWRFQTDIKDQVPDMSSELVSFLNCMRKELNDNNNFSVGEISSISDGDYVGNLKACDIQGCSNCVHECQSCHYGGGTGSNKSYAVDLGDETNGYAITRAANACNAKTAVIKSDHVHVSITACPK